MFSENYKDITELNRKLTRKLVYAHPDDLDVMNSMDFQLNDVMVSADSCAYDFDLKDIWVTSNRWTSLTRQYLDPVGLEGFLGQVEAKLRGRKRGIAFLRTNDVKPRTTKTNSKVWRRWGSCMLGIGYTSLPRPTITLHSRTTYLGYIGQLDLAMVHVLAREIGERVGLTPEEIRFVWHIEGAQFHSFKSMAWFFQNERDRARLEDTPHSKKLQQRAPVLWLSQKRLAEYQAMDDNGLLYCDMSFSQQLRIRRRWHTEVYGPTYGKPWEGGTKLKSPGMAVVAPVLPSIPTAKLDLKKLRQVNVQESMIEEAELKTGILSTELDESMMGDEFFEGID